MNNVITFKVNGVKHQVGSEVDSDVMLVDYLRNTLELRGTKYMCREGGCGACTVNASTYPGEPAKSVNACLISITSCQDWDITTIEGLGNKKDGYHPLQKSLAENHGTQCGHCTPGFVMAMNGFLESNDHNVSMLDIENAFGSNICRCTGYRPIVECFKKFGKDAPKELKIKDIESLSICKKNAKNCRNSCTLEDDWCVVPKDSKCFIKKIKLKDGKMWYRMNKLDEVLQLIRDELYGLDYMLVAGNTAKGVAPIDEYPPHLVDISHLKELKTISFDQNLILGAGLTLTQLVNALKEYSSKEYFSYLEKLHEHVLLVAHFPVRNVGTIAGNLMIKYKQNSFQSDIFLIFETVGAQLTIMDKDGTTKIYTMQEFLKVDMNGKIIFNVLLPPLGDEYKIVTFKLMPRAQSAHAVVNAGFMYNLDTSNVVQEARIVYGALSTHFIRATATEAYLVGKNLFKNETLQAAINVLDGELVVEEEPPAASAEYRRHVAKALFYKGLLSLCPSSLVNPRFQSGTVKIHEARGLSDAKQTYPTDTSVVPAYETVQKLEGLYQCSGEALYTEDYPKMNDEVFGAFVLSTAIGNIVTIDPSEALEMKGVIAFYTAKDIPGLNSFTPSEMMFFSGNEEILADGVSKYYYQPLGIIVAETMHIANRATELVRVTYSNISKRPIIDIKEAKKDETRNTLFFSANATNVGTDIKKTITGETTFYGQYHNSMETLVSFAKPTEEGLEVHTSTQFLDGTQVMISRALGIPQNKIDVFVRRLGGSFGLKISRSIAGATACSLVCHKLQRPCRFIQPLTTNMRAVGKRYPFSNDYEVAVNGSGVIQYLTTVLYEDNGYKVNETITPLGVDVYSNCYDISKINYKVFDTLTDTAKNTFCRSPGTLETIDSIETIMERISYELSLDSIEVRQNNIDKTKYEEFLNMITKLKEEADYTSRKAAVNSFNTQNRWKKRGLRFAAARWSPAGGQRLDVNLSVFHGDGTIVIVHSGIEMGQGINTKVAQVAAYLLGVKVSNIQIKANDTTCAPNSFITGGSLTHQNLIIALRRCCNELLERLKPIRETLTNYTWPELIKAAYDSDVDLQAHGFVNTGDIQHYDVYGIALSEVEIDCLTGEYEILRVDLYQDVGLSINPAIDIGQVEGGFIMGVGYWTCEKLVYDPQNGKILTDRTWDYHLPEARDIPQQFNVHIKEKSYSNEVIFGSKATGEPSTCVAIVVPFAIREAITSARQESGIPTTDWFEIDGPYSTEAVCMATKTNVKDFIFN